MKKTNIDASIFQEMLDSASNAAAKGQAQYFTPESWAKVLSLPLHQLRPVIVDFTCGNGSLLTGVRNVGHAYLLGCDIDASPLSTINPQLSTNFVTADVTKFYPYLRDIRFTADCFVLNPPWDLHWYREQLALLAESYCPSVAVAFAAHDERTGKDTIDSTAASICLALDRMTDWGEGFLIGNESTLQRLLLGPDAPHGALAEHVWAHLIIDGNICQPGTAGVSPTPSTLNSQLSTGFKTGVIYFARGHTYGMLSDSAEAHVSNLEEAEAACRHLRAHRLDYRKGPRIMGDTMLDANTVDYWRAAIEEWNITRQPSLVTHPYHLWLEYGRIRTHLSVYDQQTGREAKAVAARLHDLNGKTPMQLVVQVSQRRQLEAAVNGGTWRVEPALQQAVAAAVAEYHLQCAPLYPLPPIKRLGHLDEHEQIECRQDLRDSLGRLAFRAGEKYPLRSLTTQVLRSGTKLNLKGEVDDIEWNGSELGFFIRDVANIERLFMEGRLRDPSIKVTIDPPAGARELVTKLGADQRVLCAIDFTLQELVEHFIIPEVRDVATLNPQGYQRNLALLAEIETLCT